MLTTPSNPALADIMAEARRLQEEVDELVRRSEALVERVHRSVWDHSPWTDTDHLAADEKREVQLSELARTSHVSTPVAAESESRVHERDLSPV